MLDGEQDVVPIELDEETFYLAFAPMPETGWSFGMLVPESEISEATAGTQDYFLKQISNLQKQMRQQYSYVNNLVVVVPIAVLIILFFMS